MPEIDGKYYRQEYIDLQRMHEREVARDYSRAGAVFVAIVAFIYWFWS